MDPCIKQAPVLSKRFWIIPWPLAYNRLELDCIRKIINFWYTFGWKWRVFVTIYDCRTHVRMTSMTSSVERTDLNFKISVALLLRLYPLLPKTALTTAQSSFTKSNTALFLHTISVCVRVCVCAWSGWFLLQSPEMKLSFLLQFISRWKTFTSYVIGAEPWCGATSVSANNVLCLLTFARRWSRIALTLSAGVLPPGCSKTSVRQYLISNIRKTSLIRYRIIKHIWLII